VSGDQGEPELFAPEDKPEEVAVQPDAADPRDLRKRRARKKIVAREDEIFIRRLLAAPEGRRFLWGILAAAHTFEERFSIGGYGFPIEQEIWFNAGQQQLGQRLYQTWDFLDHEGVSLMLREHDARFSAKQAT